jgi:molecular chaperone DnaK
MHLGIDFGTSYTKLGYISNGQFINLAGPGAQIPTLVVYLPDRDKLYFGNMARRLNEPQAMQVRFFKLELKRNPQFTLGPYNLEDIVKAYFLFLKDEYISPKGKKVESVAISVPNYFGLKARRILLEAARTSFEVEEIYLLPEPVAALLGYNFEQNTNFLEGDILAVDIGGGTTDFSFVSLSREHNEIIMESQFQIGHDSFSGSELDRGILRSILNPLFKMQHGYEIPARILSEKNGAGEDRYWFNQLMATAEAVKIEMGRQDPGYFNIPAFYQQDSLLFSLPAEVFMAQLNPIFTRLSKYINEHVRERAEYLGLYRQGRFELDYLLLLGGASRTRGVYQLITRVCPGLTIICPQDLSFNVVRGLCLWKEKGLSSFISVKSIYPFNFYIEKWDKARGGTVLEKIPFDTDNLELDINSRYKVFTVPLQSPYNLSAAPDNLKLRVYELAQADLQASVDHFIGQDLILQVDQPETDREVDLYLNLGSSRIELDGKDINHTSPVNNQQVFSRWLTHQNTALDLLQLYPDSNAQLVHDFQEYLKLNFHQPAAANQDYSILLTYKLLAFLQLLT